MSDDMDDGGADWAGTPYPGSAPDDGGGGGPVQVAPGVFAGDFVNGKGLLGMVQTAGADGGAPPAAPDWGPNQPVDPYDAYAWMQRLGDHAIPYKIDNGRNTKDTELSVFEAREGPDGAMPGAYGIVDADDYVPGQQDDQPTDWRRYPAPNVRQDLSHPILQDPAAYQAARTYLNGNPESAARGARIDAAHIPVVMIPEDPIATHNTRFEVGPQSWPNGIVYWHPRLGTLVPLDASRGSFRDALIGRAPVQSPSLALDHEFGHADRWLRDPAGYAKDLKHKTYDDWTNLEEKRNIQDVETPAARRLGEPTRSSHGGTYVPAPTVPRRK
jgi:hypothetical protein